MLSSEVQNLIDIFIGADKLDFWMLLAVASTLILATVLVMLIYDKTTPNEKYIGSALGAAAFCLIAYAGLFVTYFYNLPMGTPMELVIR